MTQDEVLAMYDAGKITFSQAADLLTRYQLWGVHRTISSTSEVGVW